MVLGTVSARKLGTGSALDSIEFHLEQYLLEAV